MKFSILSSFILFGAILAAPTTAPIEKRDTISSIGSIIATLDQTVQANVNDISGFTIIALVCVNKGNTNINIALLTSTIKGSVDASAAVVANVSADYVAIAAAFADATKAIVATTVGGLGGIIVGLQGIKDDQLASLTASLATTIALLKQIQVAVAITATNLSPAAQAAIEDEIAAVNNAILPFVGPLTVFATAVAAARLSVSVVLTGLRTAIIGLVTIASTFLAGV
ncbi:hypothetical protein VTL71DRAFT_1495 [Oculimacula yallundae]|uniref:Uncharacterized protein n=1 Tax=Oculimacula yallundae TaxID=86028 RepID=A0ABR4CC78_9HELO